MNKQEAYTWAKEELRKRLAEERDLIANLANTSAILSEAMEEINWVGFYLHREDELLLGPFQGRAACTRIALGSGVCGTAFVKGETLVVPDVHQFPGHIACDARSRSEIVVPLFAKGVSRGVLDIDSPILNRFEELDRENLEEIAKLLERSCRW